MTFIKICGITNLDDARVAAAFGADSLGFNFYTKSPRFIAHGAAREIINEVGESVMTVGVFVNEPVERVQQMASEADIGMIQLHGDETAEYVKEIKKRCGLEVIKAFRISQASEIGMIDDFAADDILLDAYSPILYGGSGETTDWGLARRFAEAHPKVYLAGGLNAENVKIAIKTVRPFAVDVASGVESVNGRKDQKKLEEFIRNAKNA
ncbi:phosphoribosylanthranilate isomerase [soil metagenome]